MRLEQDRAQCGAQRQCVDCRKDHRHGNRNCELLEESAAQARYEGDRHEDRQKHKGNGDDRAGDFAHCAPRRVSSRHAGVLLHHALDILDHDNCVVDDDADGEH
jgi:hypothetical protein